MAQQMKTEWEDLRDTVSRVIQEGRLGTPSAVRCLVRAGQDADSIRRGLENLQSLVNAWFESEPTVTYSIGTPEGGHVITSLRYPGGQTAVLSAGAGPGGDGSGGDLMLLGSRGSLYFDIPSTMEGGA